MSLSSYYSKKTSLYRPSKSRELKILDLLPLSLNGLKVIDIGCGDGAFGKILKSRGAFIIGVDISAKAIKSASNIFDKTILIDLNNKKTNLRRGSVDIVVASEVIEHLYNPDNLLRESRRILKIGGFLILSTPNVMYWGNRIKFLNGEFRYTKSGVFDESHLHFYTHSTLGEVLDKNGFKIVEENHVYPGNFPFKERFPGLFSYQFIVKCKKK